MPLILALALLLGLAVAIQLLARRWNIGPPARLDTRSEAMAAWRRAHRRGPQPTAILPARDGGAALVALPSGHGLVWPEGRMTRAAHLAGPPRDTAGGLALPLAGGGTREVTLETAERDAWRAWIGGG